MPIEIIIKLAEVAEFGDKFWRKLMETENLL